MVRATIVNCERCGATFYVKGIKEPARPVICWRCYVGPDRLR